MLFTPTLLIFFSNLTTATKTDYQRPKTRDNWNKKRQFRLCLSLTLRKILYKKKRNKANIKTERKFGKNHFSTVWDHEYLPDASIGQLLQFTIQNLFDVVFRVQPNGRIELFVNDSFLNCGHDISFSLFIYSFLYLFLCYFRVFVWI